MLQNKVVVITGSGQGIGKHAAKTFAQAKAKVVIADFNAELAKQTAAEIGQTTETMAVAADVRNEDSVKSMVDQVMNRFGQIDVMMNNAAIVPHFAWNIPRWPLIADMPVEFWDRVVHTNLYGTFFGTKHVIPHMVKRKSGHIINLYGGGGVKPGGAWTYMVTKDGIRTFTRYVAEEVRDANIVSSRFHHACRSRQKRLRKRRSNDCRDPKSWDKALSSAPSCRWSKAGGASPMRTAGSSTNCRGQAEEANGQQTAVSKR